MRDRRGCDRCLVATKLRSRRRTRSCYRQGRASCRIRNRGLGFSCVTAPDTKRRSMRMGVPLKPASRISRSLPLRPTILSMSPIYITHLFHRDTMVMTLQNGIPWLGVSKDRGGARWHAAAQCRPSGTLVLDDRADRIIGCVAYPAATVVTPASSSTWRGIGFLSAS